jgi:hypothetical protein
MRTDQRRRDRSRAVRAHLNPLQRTSLFLVTALQTAFRTRNGSICRAATGIAARAGAHRPPQHPPRCLRARTRRPTFPPGVTALQAAFRTRTGSRRSGRQDRVGRGKLLIRRRLERAGSPVFVRLREPGSRGLPRFEPSTRGPFREKADYSNLNRRSDRIPASEPGIEKETEAVALVSTRHSPRQFPLRPYTAPLFPAQPWGCVAYCISAITRT